MRERITKTPSELQMWIDRMRPVMQVLWGSEHGVLTTLGFIRFGEAYAEYWFSPNLEFEKVKGLIGIEVEGPRREDQWRAALERNAPEDILGRVTSE